MTHAIGKWMLAGALLASPLAAEALATGADDVFPYVVSGTLSKLDLAGQRGLLTTDLGRPVFFNVPKAYLFENVTLGARITLELDRGGRAVKVMDTSLPDLMPAPATNMAVQPPPAGATGLSAAFVEIDR